MQTESYFIPSIAILYYFLNFFAAMQLIKYYKLQKI